MEASNRDKAKKIAQLQEFVARFAAGQRSSQVQSRRKEIARLTPTELKKSNIQRPYIRFEQRKTSGREIVSAQGLTKAFDGKTLFKNFNLDIARGDRVAIIGGNGVGKTTLLRCLIGEVEPDAGKIKWGTNTSWGYYQQDYTGQVTPGMTALDWLMQFETDEGQQGVRGLLGRMLFSGEESLKSTENLSGGETARLLMARLMMQKEPVLILDEPTNHLDLESVSALSEGLALFAGTIFLVSHDRDLISEVATRILSFTPAGLLDFRGTYEEYLEAHPLPEMASSGKW
ncbi:MAG: ATP-binding cassette domain-containing protein [Chloroflexi bacterium]|nr:ATP-binding cassette domain-containing protein [Chloroflexota bacterium]